MNNMIEVKTSELEGAALDWAVMSILQSGDEKDIKVLIDMNYSPSSKWGHGGELIEQWDLMFNHCCGMIRAEALGGIGMGKTYLIAAMRAIVASELGETARVPRELMS